MDGVKDDIVPHLSSKKTTLEMWKALESLYQSKNENRRMVLQERMSSTKMTKGEGVVPYLTRLTQIRDELGVVGSKTDNEELVWIALNGFSKPWTSLSKAWWLERSSLTGRDCGMTLCKKRSIWVKA